MKTELKKAIAILLSLVLMAAAFPLGASAFTDEELTASAEGVVIQDYTFEYDVRVFGCSDEENIPSITFINCTFKNIEAIVGGDWDLIFEGNTTIDGKINVVNETGGDVRFTEDFLLIKNPPTGTEITAPDSKVSVYTDAAAASYNFNNAVITKTNAEKAVEIRQDFMDLGDSTTTSLYLNGAPKVVFGDGCEYGNVNFGLEEEDAELELNLSDGFAGRTLGVSATRNDRCSCSGDGPCTCTCCAANGCAGCQCGWHCSDRADCECFIDYTPGTLKITGTASNDRLVFSGIEDISMLTGSADIIIDPWYDGTNINIGDKNVRISGESAGTINITASSGANINVADISNQSVTINGSFNIGTPHIFGDGDVFVGTTDPEIVYSLECGGVPLDFEKDIDLELKKTSLNVSEPLVNPTSYDFRAEKGGVSICATIYEEDIIIALPDGTRCSNRIFNNGVEILCISEDDNDCTSVEFDNCTINGDVTLQFNGNSTEVRFSGSNTITGGFRVESNCGDRRFLNEGAFIWNIPDSTPITSNEVRLSVCGDRTGQTINLNGVQILTGNAEDPYYNINLNYCCRADHPDDYNSYDHTLCDPAKQNEAIYFSGNIASFTLPDNSPVTEMGMNNVFSDITGNITKTDDSACPLYFRAEPARNDNPDDDNTYMENARLFLAGEVTERPVELIGLIDISALSYTGTGDNRLNIGTWESFTDVNIGTHSVNICGGGEYEVRITAQSGAYINLDNEHQCVNVNNGEFNMGLPHIFGTENNYNVFVGTANSDIVYKLKCEGNEVGVNPETYEEDNKTHLNPAECFNNINDWYLEATYKGITIFRKLAHKEWLCPEHDFTEWTIVTPATCTETGLASRYCTKCGFTETSMIFPSHSFTARNTGAAYLKSAADCENAAVYYKSCKLCGASSKGTSEEDTFFSGSPLGHTKGTAVKENEVAATCTKTGSYDSVVYCSVCDKELSRIEVTLPKLAHTSGTPVKENNVEPTFDNAGSFDSVVYCTVCHNEIYRTKVTVPALRHTAAKPVKENVVNATCTKTGSYDEVTYCVFCNAEMSRATKTTPCISHTAAKPVKENVVNATCTKTGSYDEVTYCIFCHALMSRTTKTTPCLGHTFGAWTQTLAPTTETAGKESRTCTVCKKTETREIPKLTGITVTRAKDIVPSAAGKIFTAPGLTVSQLLNNATPGAVIIDAQGKPVEAGKALGTGMRVAILQGSTIITERTVIIPGDIDGDSAISSADARLALRAAVKLDKPNEVQSLAALVNGAKIITASEARLILRSAVGLEDARTWLSKIV